MTSYHKPLGNLFDEVGKHLKPKAQAIINLRDTAGAEERAERETPTE